MKTYSSTWALDGGEWSASRPGCFTFRETALGTHWIGGWVSPRAGLDAVMCNALLQQRKHNAVQTLVTTQGAEENIWI
jgi:hypothetical protein